VIFAYRKNIGAGKVVPKSGQNKNARSKGGFCHAWICKKKRKKKGKALGLENGKTEKSTRRVRAPEESRRGVLQCRRKRRKNRVAWTDSQKK